MGMYVWEKHTTYRVQYYPWFQVPTGGLGMYPPQIRGDCITIFNSEHLLSEAKGCRQPTNFLLMGFDYNPN